MPTQPSKMQKDQNVKYGFLVIIGTRREEEAVANMMVSKRECEIILEDVRALKMRDPSVTADMKHAKIMPKGRLSFLEADFRAGDQKKTNRYMLPSKKQEARPSVSIRLSVKNIFRAFLAGVDVVAVSDVLWLSPWFSVWKTVSTFSRLIYCN